MSWIRVESTVREHRKINRLVRSLALPRPHAVGHVVCLWTWAAEHAPDGDLADMTADEIAEAAQWSGDPDVFLAAMVAAKLLDRTDHGYAIHDWMEFAEASKAAKRQAKRRATKREREPRHVTSRDCSVTVTEDGTGRDGTDGTDGTEDTPPPEVLVQDPSGPAPATTAEAAPAPVALIPEPVVLSLPLRKGKVYEVTDGQLRRWCDDYPGLNVLDELRKLRARWEADATRRPASKPAASIVGWLNQGANMQARRSGGGPNVYPPRLTPAERQIAETRAMADEIEARGRDAHAPASQGALVLRPHRSSRVARAPPSSAFGDLFADATEDPC